MNKTNSSTTPGTLFGIRSLIEAIEAGREIDKIYLQKNLQGALFKELWHYIKEYKLPYAIVPASRIQQHAQRHQNHQGVVAFVSAVPTVSLEEVVQQTFEKGEDPLIVLLDRVSDVRNFGAIARTAEAAGAHALVITTKNSAAVNEDALKTSAGALQHLALCKSSNLNETITWLKMSGLKVYGASEKAGQLHYHQIYEGPVALILGSEDKGIAPERLKLCDALIKLPMLGKVGSLNVSVAAGALLYEIVRQRSLGK